MARAIWTGSINFGLVSIPVGLYSATADHTVHFHQFQRGTADRIPNQRVNERTGKTRTNRAGIATFVMRGKEYLTAIRADENGMLALETLFFADEIRNPPDELDAAPARGKELDMAMSLIESMSGPWRPQDYHDRYTQRVERLIEDKHRGRETVTESGPPEP